MPDAHVGFARSNDGLTTVTVTGPAKALTHDEYRRLLEAALLDLAQHYLDKEGVRDVQRSGRVTATGRVFGACRETVYKMRKRVEAYRARGVLS